MWVVTNRKLFYTLSGLAVLASFVSLFVWGLKPGIDFTGGSLIEVAYPNGRPEQAAVTAAIIAIDPGASIRASTNSGVNEFIVRMKEVNETEKAAVMSALSVNGTSQITVKTFDSIEIGRAHV